MRILALVQGHYGKRMVEIWQGHLPEGWVIASRELLANLPIMIEDPNSYLPQDIPQTDLVISLGEQPGAAELIPGVVEASGAKGVIAPVDNRAWLPPGLARQVGRTLEKKGVAFYSPVPFCSLQEGDSQDPLIREFAHHFGRPEVRCTLQGGRLAEVRVTRSAPCGSTYFVAAALVGTRLQDAEEKAGLLHHNYPCLATMVVDWEFHDTLMHRAGYFTKEAVHKGLKG